MTHHDTAFPPNLGLALADILEATSLDLPRLWCLLASAVHVLRDSSKE